MSNKLLDYAGPHKKKMIYATLVLLFSVFIGIIPFFISYEVIVKLVQGEKITLYFIMLRSLAVFICFTLQAFFYVRGLALSHKAAYEILMRIRISLQKKMEKLPLGIVYEKGLGTLKKLFVDDVDSLELLLAHSLPEGIANLMIPILVYILMFIIDWKLALMSLASIPISILAMQTMYSIGVKEMGSYYKSAQDMNNTIIEYINGMEVIKVFNKEGESYEKFKSSVLNYRDLTLKWFKSCWIWMSIYGSLLPCTIILTLPLGSWFVLKGYSTFPNFILVLCLSLSIGIPLLKVLNFMPTLPQLNYKISELEKVMESKPLKETNEDFKGKDHTVEFKNVFFGYGEKEVLNNINVTAKSGTMTALVGESGSGKSTIAKLLIHYYDINKGSISIGGQNIYNMSLEALNNEIAYVSQEQYLFNTSIMENIRLGKPKATAEEVINAAKKAKCLEFVKELPDGFNTIVGDGGNKLSGGQKQRVTLARAILKDSPIIVLDEATAFVDPENEEKIEKVISDLVKNKTLFIIAHRLSSITRADQICVLNKGKIISKGSHNKLLRDCKIYRKLWNISQNSLKWQPRMHKEVEA